MNQGKLEVVKQEMARVIVDILGISELKWTGLDEFNSDDHYIYYCGQESLRRNGVTIIVNKRVQNAVLGCNLKIDRMISVRFQGKSFKWEMARMNIDILGISELKWTGMGKFNSDDHYIYYCGQESLRRNEVALIVNKRVRNAVLGCNLKNDRMISVCFQGKPFNITVIQVYAPTSNAEETEVEWFYEDLQDLLELTPKKDVLFIIVDWSAKVGCQEIPGVTGKFGLRVQNEAGQS